MNLQSVRLHWPWLNLKQMGLPALVRCMAPGGGWKPPPVPPLPLPAPFPPAGLSVLARVDGRATWLDAPSKGLRWPDTALAEEASLPAVINCLCRSRLLWFLFRVVAALAPASGRGRGGGGTLVCPGPALACPPAPPLRSAG